MRPNSLPNPSLLLLACLPLCTHCGRKLDPAPRPRAEPRACVAQWTHLRLIEVRLPETDLQGETLVGLEAIRVYHLPLGPARPTSREVLARGEVILERRRPDLPDPGQTARLDLTETARPTGWIVVAALRVGNVVGEPSEVLPWLHPAVQVN